MKLFTIGFTKKTAAEFFGLLKQNNIQRLVDIRISPDGQLSGFARQKDLPYFLDALANEGKTFVDFLSKGKTMREIEEAYQGYEVLP